MKPVPVPTRSSLDVSYVLHEAPDPVSRQTAVLLHGLCHSRAMFEPLIAEMNALGIHVASVDTQSEHARHRNLIGLSEYRDGFAAAVAQIQNETGRRIGSIAGHSMGGQIVQEVMQEHPPLRRPSAFLAPVPLGGAWKAVLRTGMRSPSSLLRTFRRLDVRDAMRSPEEVRMLFFDEKTPEEIVERTRSLIRHTSYRAYQELVGRPLLRPRIRQTLQKSMLVSSPTDFLFRPEEYEDLQDAYPHLERHQMAGGHDFFIEYARPTAKLLAEFHLNSAG